LLYVLEDLYSLIAIGKWCCLFYLYGVLHYTTLEMLTSLCVDKGTADDETRLFHQSLDEIKHGAYLS